METFDLFPPEALSESMSSAVASHAKTSATPANALGSTANGQDYGASTPELLASYDRASLSWKTSQLCLDGELSAFSETWPRSGLMQNGIAYQLPPLVRLTDVTEFGSLPTPTVGDSKSARNSTAQRRSVPPSGVHAGDTLTDYVTQWATATALDWRSAKRINVDKRSLRRRQLNEQVVHVETQASLRQEPHATGSLNPMWVEWLMGFPLAWTALDVSATPSSRRSRKSSGGQS